MRQLLFIAACMGLVITPFLFESYTFYRYTIREPDFYVFSGARLWFFVASELSIGFAIGRLTPPSICGSRLHRSCNSSFDVTAVPVLRLPAVLLFRA